MSSSSSPPTLAHISGKVLLRWREPHTPGDAAEARAPGHILQSQARYQLPAANIGCDRVRRHGLGGGGASQRWRQLASRQSSICKSNLKRPCAQSVAQQTHIRTLLIGPVGSTKYHNTLVVRRGAHPPVQPQPRGIRLHGPEPCEAFPGRGPSRPASVPQLHGPVTARCHPHNVAPDAKGTAATGRPPPSATPPYATGPGTDTHPGPVQVTHQHARIVIVSGPRTYSGAGATAEDEQPVPVQLTGAEPSQARGVGARDGRAVDAQRWH